MIKLSTLFWLVLVSTAGFAMFAVKYGVQSLEDELNRTRTATMAEQHAIRTDEAEWAYLTRPDTLDEMNRRYLSLGPIATKQLRVTLTDIPLRAPAPVPVDTPVVAAASHRWRARRPRMRRQRRARRRRSKDRRELRTVAKPAPAKA